MTRPADVHLAIDRIEGAWAHLEGRDGAFLRVPRAWLPAAAAEADVLRVAARPEGDAAAVLRFEIDRGETRRRLDAARERLERLPKAPKGDLDL